MATNIAETSITISGISHVVDSCYVKIAWFNPETSVDMLLVTAVSQAAAEQRAGRAGRTKAGKCYRLRLHVPMGGNVGDAFASWPILFLHLPACLWPDMAWIKIAM